jgi:hypothetical protein
MQVSPDIHLPPAGRDYRLDVLRGIANWAIFLDHIPNNVVNWVTTRNYRFSDAADLFIFISGWTVAFVYGRMMINRGYIIAATRIGKRAWQIYVAHLVFFVMYIAADRSSTGTTSKARSSRSTITSSLCLKPRLAATVN